MNKIAFVVGARPQFIKLAPLFKAYRLGYANQFRILLIHTGQHYDPDMSERFFQELEIPRPDYHLGIGPGSIADQFAKMVSGLDKIYGREQPTGVVVFGDTTSTLAGAISAITCNIPLAHVEAGLRSYNPGMPEEVNRRLTDHASTLLFCPTRQSVKNLEAENIRSGHAGKQVVLCGDVMYDQFVNTRKSIAVAQPGFKYFLVTLHRNFNTDDPAALRRSMLALADLAVQTGTKALFPVHPRTLRALDHHGIAVDPQQVQLMEPQGYAQIQGLVAGAEMVVTDSGGLQKEAFFHGVPVILMRTETEWSEIIEEGWGRLADSTNLLEAWQALQQRPELQPPLFGAGKAAETILRTLSATLG
jgi:UDP-N-acetylglucosamine 2-epimerase